jgi:hypothetical protein
MRRGWDRLSVAVSALLIAGLITTGWAMMEASATNPPQVKKLKKRPAPIARNLAMPPASIRLPPPPRRKLAKASPVRPRPISKAPPTKVLQIKPLRAAPRPVAVARAVPEKVKPVLIKPLRPEPIKAAPRQKPVAKARPETVTTPTQQDTKTGRALLRMVEHGKGPSIRIAWPEARAARDRLYRLLSNCYGMRAAIMSNRQLLYRDAGSPGESWKIDTDRFSGFLRVPEGEPIVQESAQFTAISTRHKVARWQPVRVFPRHVDAVLLGGLNQVLGSGYATARSITAAYRLNQGKLTLSDIRADGRGAAGIIALPSPRRRCA